MDSWVEGCEMRQLSVLLCVVWALICNHYNTKIKFSPLAAQDEVFQTCLGTSCKP